MRKLFFIEIILGISSLLFLSLFSCTNQTENKSLSKEEMIDRGSYLVTFGGCNHCHTPKIMTDKGPILDTTRLLAGHSSDEQLPYADMSMLEPGKWSMTVNNRTAWVGPWGISYSANLTPDNATGLGAISEEMFIKTLREGKIKGVGRTILPPMPWQDMGLLSDEDLKCIYVYLRSIKPVHNTVPQPVSPDKVAEILAKK